MKLLFLLLSACLGILISCSRGVDQKAEASEVLSQQTLQTPNASEGLKIMSNARPKEETFADQAIVPVAEQGPEIIRTAHLVHEVKNSQVYSSYVRNRVRKLNAYIFKEDNNVADNRAQTTMVIKVPVALFDSLVAELMTKEVNPLQKNITSEDITSEIIDTRARLETRKATRAKYLEFLNKANKIDDVLKIQQEINNIQEDIESAEARLSQLSGQARYRTVNLTYFEPGSGYEDYDNNPGFWTRVGSAVKNGAGIFGEIFIAFITAWPFWVAGLVLGFLIRKYRRRNKILVRK